MGRFLKRILLLLLVPVLLLAAVYFVTDPYKTLRPFSLTYFDSTNRDYLSSELFLLNADEQRYDSYIFGSSRGCGINSYHWLKYLPEGSKQFLFQAWSETITGIDQKVSYIDEHQYNLRNALILIDIPGTFAKSQLPTQALTIKDPHFSGQPRWLYQATLLFDFLQKPSEWVRAVRKWLHPRRPNVVFDSVSNDWEKGNRDLDVNTMPEKDNLKNLTRTARAAFFKNYVDNPYAAVPASEPLVDDAMVRTMEHIREVFRRHGTDYRIIVTPGYRYEYPPISSRDLEILQSVFGQDRVFDFSGRTDMTSDYDSFSDSNHFGLRIGWMMLEEIFNPENSF